MLQFHGQALEGYFDTIHTGTHQAHTHTPENLKLNLQFLENIYFQSCRVHLFGTVHTGVLVQLV